MRSPVCWLLASFLLLARTPAGAVEHSVVLGSWRVVKSVADSGEVREVRVRRLLVDGKLKEYTAGPAHDVTDRLFVVQRVYRVNDALPRESQAQWIWRLDGWISVDRATGHVAQLALPAFDPESSVAVWYRDYVAYCGTSDEGRGVLVVAQAGKRKAAFRKEFGGSGCEPPSWERGPMRVTFQAGGEKTVFAVRPRSGDLQSASTEEEGPQ